jgi:uncharacterized membrane protein
VSEKQERWLRIGACTGMIIAPLLWTVNTQLGLILPYTECGSRFRPVLISSIIVILLAVGAAVVSWRSPWPGHTGRFWSGVCALLGLLFAFAMLLQAAAAFMLTGCER